MQEPAVRKRILKRSPHPWDKHQQHSINPCHYPLEKHDVDRMRQAYRRLLAQESPDIQGLGQKVFHRIAHSNWSVEWNLPRWLGTVCDLTLTQHQRLLTANVFGLGFIRLMDDRSDGEGSSGGEGAAHALETALYRGAQVELRQMLGEDRWFWDHHESYMTRWHEAENLWQQPLNVLAIDPEQLSRVADIGAPLFICCAAAVALQPDHQPLEKLVTPVRHYLTAAVLYDHWKDWQADLASERPNLFIMAMLPEGIDPQARGEMRAEVHRTLLEGEKVQAYLHLLLDELCMGVESARVVELIPFARHLAALEREARESGSRMLKGIENYLTQGMAILLPA